MPIEVTDLVQGASCQITPDGVYYVRPLLVTGLDKTATDLDNAKFMLYAMAQVDSAKQCGFGRPHPSIPGLVVEKLTAGSYLDAKDKALVTAYYRDIGNIRVRINGTLTREATRFDNSGTLLSVNYDAAHTEQSYDATGKNTGVVDYAQVPLLVPGMTVEYDFCALASVRSTDFATGNPFKTGVSILSKINSAPWQGQPKHTWACIQTSGTPMGYFAPNGDSTSLVNPYWLYKLAFEFVGFKSSQAINTFDPVLIYTRYQTNRPPAGINPKQGGFPGNLSGNGWRQIVSQIEYDFNTLKLPDLWRI